MLIVVKTVARDSLTTTSSRKHVQQFQEVIIKSQFIIFKNPDIKYII